MAIFSVPTFFVMLRETVEVGAIVAVLLQTLQRLKRQDLTKQVWAGVIAGSLVSLLIAGIFITIFHVMKSEVFDGKSQKVFEGVLMMVAVVVITLLAGSLFRISSLKERWEKKIEQLAIDNDAVVENKTTIFVLSFSSVVREGIESVLFIGGVGSNEEGEAIPLAVVVGILAGIAIAVVMFFSGKQLDLQKFFTATTIFLLLIAAGLASHGMHEFQEADAFGPWKLVEERDWHNEALWDWSSCCSDKDNAFFTVLRALFGYQDKPTFVEIISYVLYWVFAGASIAVGLHVIDKRDKSKHSDKVTSVDLTPKYTTDLNSTDDSYSSSSDGEHSTDHGSSDIDEESTTHNRGYTSSATDVDLESGRESAVEAF